MNKKEGYNKILDYWTPPKEAGDPIGFIATTYTFKADFFEEECLSRFLKMETDPDEDGPVFLIEREEKLNSIKCASVWVDESHCKTMRNLRWDLIPIRIEGIFHPKISLLCWSNCIRLIVASANLTPEGYRKNQEIFGVIDYMLPKDNDSPNIAPVYTLKQYLSYFEDILSNIIKDSLTIKARCSNLISTIKEFIKSWKFGEQDESNTDILMAPLLIGPGRKDLFSQCKDLWEQHDPYSPPSFAWITSPFFDPPDAQNKPAKEIWDVLKKKGEAYLNFSSVCDKTDDLKVLFRGPESLSYFIPQNREKVGVSFHSISENINENGKDIYRPLHQKTIWFENDKYVLYIIGSSNFTSPGTGLSKDKKNFEANLAYILNKNKNPRSFKILDKSFLYGIEIKEKDLKFNPMEYKEEGEGSYPPPLPAFFKSCEIIFEDGTYIQFQFDPSHDLSDFRILSDKGILLIDKNIWKQNNSPDVFKIKWDEKSFPSGFDVFIKDNELPSWIPLIVADYKALPPPDEIRDLPLESLIEILSSSKPLHILMRRYLAKHKKRNKGEKDDINIDPHKKVDTSGFILQRTRKISYAYRCMKERLSRPVFTLESLEWRLRGPIGIKKLCDALIKDIEESVHNDVSRREETLFFFAELIFELSKIEPKFMTNSLSKEEIFSKLFNLFDDLYKENEFLFKDASNTTIGKYAKKTFTRSLKTLKNGMAV